MERVSEEGGGIHIGGCPQKGDKIRVASSLHVQCSFNSFARNVMHMSGVSWGLHYRVVQKEWR